MKRFFIVTNLVKDPMQETTGYIKRFLEQRGAVAEVLMRDAISKHELYESKERNPLLVPDDTECILVLGGDGTLLQAARDTLRLDIPLLGINLGRMGFLAEVEKGRIDQALEHLLEDEYEVEDRMLLYGELVRDGEVVASAHALNDIVTTRRGPLMVLPFDLCVNEQKLASYFADGIIVSTPTGSTGYNLSAGGPIVNPRASLLVVSPICPHTLNTRSIVLSPEDEVSISLGKLQEDKTPLQNAEITFDGSLSYPVENGDRIRIRKSDRKVRLIRLSSMSFLKVLHEKMRDDE
ncbi:MAG: NAD(+)/NADH kinase [Lachnospiraceae bacterium]|nr:NAD(+)/NADH kinase [Lachnospiraceae bacterium]